MENEILPRRLRNLRESRGYLQKFVADKLGVKSNTLSGYENGTRSPDPEMLVKIADLYNVSVDYLLGYSNKGLHSVDKDEKDIAKRLEEFKKDLTTSNGLSFSGEPMSEDAKESLIEAMDHIFRQTQRINKKYIPNKHKRDED